MTKSQSGSGSCVRLALALALASSCVPGVNGPGDNTAPPPSVEPPFPNGTGGGKADRASGPPPNFGAPVNSARPAKPVIGGTLLVLADARTAVAADPDRDRIFIADYRAQKLVAEIALQPGDEPGRVVADGEGRVHVVLRGGGALLTLQSTPSWSITGRRPVCVAPRGLAYDADQRQLHVACSEGELVSFPVEPDGAPVRRLELERDLRDVVVDGSALLVSRFRSAEVLTVDREGKIVARRTPGARPTLRPFTETKMDPSGARSASGGLREASMSASVSWKMIPLRQGEALMLHQRGLVDEVSASPGGYAGAECGGIIESAVTRVGPLGSDLATPSLPIGPLAVDLAVSPDELNIAVVSPGQARTARGAGFPPGSGAQVVVVPMTFSQENAGQCEGNRAFPGGAGGKGGFEGGADAGAGGAGGGSPDGGAPDAGPGDEELPPPVIDFRQPTGEAVSVVYDSRGHLIVQTREPASIQVLTSNRNVILSHDSRADTGHDIFHANAGAGIACASCHPEGGDDGRVWKFRNKAGALEVRRTQNLAGGILATAPFHWNGDLRNLDILMDEVFVGRMQGPKMDPMYVNVLGKWMDTIPALPRLPGEAGAVARGKTLFESVKVGCATCHNGALLTNNGNHDVGTGGKLQVPSLRGVVWRAPFMHDGCAATLADRFGGKCGGGDQHGVTSKLTPAEIGDLVKYVETL